MSLLASVGPFGPSAGGCLAILVLLIGPFYLLFFGLWSFATSEPMPVRRAAMLALGAVLFAGYALPGGPPGRSGFMLAWWVFGLLSVLVIPIVLVLELSKHGLIPLPQFGRSRKPKRRRRPPRRDRSADEADSIHQA
jgi:hypothetical protein